MFACECGHIPVTARHGNIDGSAILRRTCTLHQRTGPESDSTESVSIRSPQIASYRDAGEVRAMRMSLAFGVVMLVGKTAAYFMTGSAAILSDAAESVIHVVAVAFAAFSLRLSTKPAAPKFLYGYERITFFSAGFEGAMIVVAAIFILYCASSQFCPAVKSTTSQGSRQSRSAITWLPCLTCFGSGSEPCFAGFGRAAV